MRERWRQRLQPGARQEASQIVASGEPLGFSQLSGDVKEVCVPGGRALNRVETAKIMGREWRGRRAPVPGGVSAGKCVAHPLPLVDGLDFPHALLVRDKGPAVWGRARGAADVYSAMSLRRSAGRDANQGAAGGGLSAVRATALRAASVTISRAEGKAKTPAVEPRRGPRDDRCWRGGRGQPGE